MRQDVAGIFRAGWIDGLVSFFDVLNDPVFIDYKGRAIPVTTFFVEEAVVPNDLAFCKVAQDRERHADLFCEFTIGGNAVHTEPEHLSIIRFEFGDISLIRLHLLRSTTGEREHIKREHYILLAAKITQLVAHGSLVRPHDRAGQGEVRRHLPDL